MPYTWHCITYLPLVTGNFIVTCLSTLEGTLLHFIYLRGTLEDTIVFDFIKGSL